MLRRLRISAACALFAAAALAAPVVRGDTPSPASLAQAREDFRRGLALEAAGDWEGALVVFKAVALVKSTPQVRFHIAQDEEKTGDLVAALGSYRLASYEAREAKIKDVLAASEAAVVILEPKIPKLRIQRGSGAGVARVMLDGRELGPASIGASIAVNPGPHHVEATAPGHETTTVDVTLAPSESKDVALVLPELHAAPMVTSRAREDDRRTGEQPKPQGTPPLRIAGFVVGGAGVVSLAVSGIFFGIRQSAIGDLNSACGPSGQSCPANLASTRDRGQTATTVADATLIGGAVALAGGAVMVIVARKPKAPSSVGVALSPTGGALSVPF